MKYAKKDMQNHSLKNFCKKIKIKNSITEQSEKLNEKKNCNIYV